MNVNNSNCVLMCDFEEEAMTLSSRPFQMDIPTLGKTARVAFIYSTIILLFAMSFALYSVTQHHSYIKQLRRDGAQVQTISSSPSWLTRFVSARNPINNLAETVYVARLYGQSANDQNLIELSKCSKLSKIELTGPNITSAGFMALTDARNLKRIELLACENISRNAVLNFNVKRPGVKIVVRHRAYIGMMAEKTEEGFYKVVWVGEKSPAEHAGIRVQDLVTGLNGNQLECYGELHYEFNKLNPGDEIDLQVQRKNKSVKVHLELGDILENLPS